MRAARARTEEVRHRVAPVHWTTLLGAVSAACFAVLAVTGAALLFSYQPSAERLVYDGTYAPLRGVEMSRAYYSVLHLSLEVRGGLLVRQTHHWAALILPASLTLQMLVASSPEASADPAGPPGCSCAWSSS